MLPFHRGNIISRRLPCQDLYERDEPGIGIRGLARKHELWAAHGVEGRDCGLSRSV